MTWAKVCDTLHAHPKVLDADLEAMGLWVKALSHCAAYSTDGHVKRSAATNLAGTAERAERLAAQLVASGLWEPHPSGDGWQIHDFLEFNPSRDAVLRERAEGRRRAKDSFGRRSKSSGEDTPKLRRSFAEASPVLQRPVPIPSRPDPEKRGRDAAPTSPLTQGEVSSPTPDDIPITEAIRASCAMAGARAPTREDVVACLANARKKGHVRVDWSAELVSWMVRGKRYDARGPVSGRPQDVPNRSPTLQPIEPVRRPARESHG